ncbi:MAG: AAA family ATPase [Blastocatellia bacterium]
MEPLASRIRPTNLVDFVGQAHLVGPGKPLRLAIENRHLISFVLWGPPGTGKTTLARIYAKAVGGEFFELSAVSSGKEEIRRIIGRADTDRAIILFIDEIHRFNKSQQDFLLPFVENGELILIGATTENPSFEIISALLSRLRIFALKQLSPDEVKLIVDRSGFELSAEALDWIANAANGDARVALTLVENAARLYGSTTIETLRETLQSAHLRYDKKGEEYYNVISAFIKSMRAGRPDAALYYLARMIEAGEDPKFIARRMVIFASEDIGLAQPTALVVANAVFRAVETVGLPECIYNLAHGAAYLSRSAKDRSAAEAIAKAMEDARQFGNLPVPMFLRNAPNEFLRQMGYGRHNDGSAEDSMPKELRGRRYFD